MTNNVGWPWWVSVLLWFKRPIINVDWAETGADKTVKVYSKMLNGKMYVYKTEVVVPERSKD